MSGIDAVIRLAFGVLLVWLGFFAEGMIVNQLLDFLIGAFGLLNIGSGLMRFCPVYRFAGLSTVRAD
ncbi:MAG: DUF2892 domain-containing protein [Minwuia sp.]|nr:DUF2892 domain-containing protein [Minwuia sp.]